MKVSNTYRQGLKKKTIEVATALFQERGIRSVKMDDIANSLSISKRTLYELYANKEDLLYEVVTQHEKDTYMRLKQLEGPNSNVMDFIIGFIRIQIEELSKVSPIFLEEVHKYPKCLEHIKQRRTEDKTVSREFFKRGIKEGYFIENINYDIIEQLSEYVRNGIMQNFLYKKYGIKELFKSCIMTSIRAVCTEKGIKELDTFLRKLD